MVPSTYLHKLVKILKSQKLFMMLIDQRMIVAYSEEVNDKTCNPKYLR